MENTQYQYEEYSPRFESLRLFLDHINKEIKDKTELLERRYKFVADVVKVKPYNGSLYITVSQETPDGKKSELTVIIRKDLTNKILRTLNLHSEYDLEHKKWEFQGKLSFYIDRAQFSFWADSIVPQGESDILQRRQLIKERLKEEGLLTEVTHSLEELDPIKYIAVITSKTAQGYFDFLSNLLVPDNMRPTVHLYESSMQGAATAEEVINALDKIELFCKEYMIKYDLVVIIRGGGGPSDLMYFDDYNLALRIAKMNKFIPVVTGIGHEKDETIPDYVAWKRFPTPTAVAKEIANQLKTYLEKVERIVVDFSQYMNKCIDIIDTKLGENTHKTLSQLLKGKVKILYDVLVDSANILYRFSSLKSYEKVLSTDFIKGISEIIEKSFFESSRVTLENYRIINDRLKLELTTLNQRLDKYNKVSELFDREISKSLSTIDDKHGEFVKIGGPLSALSFGGAVITKDGTLINSVKDITLGDKITVNFTDGKAQALIEEKEGRLEVF
ncbi:MAG: exodeoxyribonuclease VII large subunit [Fervidobacterium sp.]